MLFEYLMAPDANGTACNAAEWRAQTFTLGTISANVDFDITSVKIFGYRSGNPAGVFTVDIQNVDVSSKPTGAILTTGSMLCSDFTPVSANRTWYEVTLTPYFLKAGTKYAAVFSAPDGDAANTIVLRFDDTASYTGGTRSSSANSGGTWNNNPTVDLLFQIYGTPHWDMMF